MKYGKMLKNGGKIGFIAPAFGCSIEPYRSAFANAQIKLKKLNYELKCGSNVYESSGVGISNTPQKCAKEFEEFYLSADCDILMSCGGGELMCEILDDIDFEKIRESPAKWFMGYSDNTNLTFLLTTICDSAAVYGPCAPAFGMEPWHDNLQDALNLLSGQTKEISGYPLWERESLKTEEHPLEPYHVTEPKILHYAGTRQKRMAQFKGRLVGGCLDSLITLCGTKYDEVEAFCSRYEDDGQIWFLEACDLNVLSIRRALWQLKHAGWFRGAAGFLIGRPLCYGENMFGVDQYTAVTSVLEDLDVPILMDVDLGHLPPMMPLVSGSMACVTAEDNDIRIQMEFR